MENLSGRVRGKRFEIAQTPSSSQSPINRLIQSQLTPLVQQIAYITRKVQDQVLLLEEATEAENSDVSQVFSQQGRATRLAENVSLIDATFVQNKEAAARRIVELLEGLESQSSTVENMLEECYGELLDIAIRVLDTWDRDNDPALIWAGTAEACYTAPVWNDEDDVYQINGLPLFKAGGEQQWADFWQGVLNKCPYASTLFNPFAVHGSEVIPPFLFRVFDKNSRGKHSESTIASQASVSGEFTSSSDLLSVYNSEEATKALFYHLVPKPFHNHQAPDNLVSWTSSLLVAIQYAIWRCHNNHTDPADVKICAVDTSKFPRGQFMSAGRLIRESNQKIFTKSAREPQGSFESRLNKWNDDYGKGEYLSQGALTIVGRSSVTSMKSLKDHGLIKLYPELEDPDGKSKWTAQIEELRQWWSDESRSTRCDLKRALTIASRCFPENMSFSIALMLLCFENRELKGNHSRLQVSGHPPDPCDWTKDSKWNRAESYTIQDHLSEDEDA